ncbi:MAG: hypothetical protein JF587_06555 [Catenulisporales bacterium]|nr:hypothetical protein [Catenulisporales bacterium]
MRCDFEVQPRILTTYADALRGGAADLAAVGGAVGRVRVERAWFGKLPQSRFMEACYARHREAELAASAELIAWLTAAAHGLAESAARYSAADRVVADLAGTTGAALGIGIETGALE